MKTPVAFCSRALTIASRHPPGSATDSTDTLLLDAYRAIVTRRHSRTLENHIPTGLCRDFTILPAK